jgi:hypothetical protein
VHYRPVKGRRKLKEDEMMNDHLIDYIVITLADVSAKMLLVAWAWIKRRWTAYCSRLAERHQPDFRC